MNLDKVNFEIGYFQGFYYIEFRINLATTFKYEFLDLFKNLLNLVEIGFALQQDSVNKVSYFTLTDYIHEVQFKVSPYLPTDWLVLGIPIANGSENFYFDRLAFCGALKSSILKFMNDQDMDYLGNPNRSKNFDGYDDEIWKVIGHEWF